MIVSIQYKFERQRRIDARMKRLAKIRKLERNRRALARSKRLEKARKSG